MPLSPSEQFTDSRHLCTTRTLYSVSCLVCCIALYRAVLCPARCRQPPTPLLPPSPSPSPPPHNRTQPGTFTFAETLIPPSTPPPPSCRFSLSSYSGLEAGCIRSTRRRQAATRRLRPRHCRVESGIEVSAPHYGPSAKTRLCSRTADNITPAIQADHGAVALHSSRLAVGAHP